MRKEVIFSLAILLSVAFIIAQPTSPPIQFYGEVSYDGSLIQNGCELTVSSGAESSTCDIVDGLYKRCFIVFESPSGQTVEYFLNSNKVGEEVLGELEAGDFYEYDIQLGSAPDCSQTSGDDGSDDTSSSSSGSSSSGSSSGGSSSGSSSGGSSSSSSSGGDDVIYLGSDDENSELDGGQSIMDLSQLDEEQEEGEVGTENNGNSEKSLFEKNPATSIIVISLILLLIIMGILNSKVKKKKPQEKPVSVVSEKSVSFKKKGKIKSGKSPKNEK